MANKQSPAVISALAEKSHMVREVASRLGFSYREEAVSEGKIVRFRFDLSEDDTQRLACEIPFEVYAYRATIGG